MGNEISKLGNRLKVPSLVTNAMLYEKLLILEKKLDLIIEQKEIASIEEISLNKASKTLRLGYSSIIKQVELGHLKARIYEDNVHKTRYRFRIADIKEFQESNRYTLPTLQAGRLKSVEEIWEEVTGQKIMRKSKKLKK